MKPVNIIGMGLSPRDLTEKHLQIIRSADIIVGGKRHLEYFKDSSAGKKEITKNISGVIDFIRERMEENAIVVLASGDPLFYGIGNLLVKSLGSDNVIIHPNVSAISGAFSRIKESWNDAHVVSLHGRDADTNLLSAMRSRDKIAVYTDPVRNPAWLAKILLESGCEAFDMCVLERLGETDERVLWLAPQDASNSVFNEPNVVVLKRKSLKASSQKDIQLGAPDEWYDHQRGLITKSEIRAVAISKLQLLPHHILWDLGAGSGSISIESSVFLREGEVYAVEKNWERIKQIEANRSRFGSWNLNIYHLVLPDGLDDLPAPDRVFIGGGGSGIDEIILKSHECLKPDGRIVVNTVVLENFETSRKLFQKIGMKTDILQIQVNRSKNMNKGKRFEAQNPVWIISGQKEKP
jgi:precorrin-6Y C5,15-methyltransferase (decarboxylating)